MEISDEGFESLKRSIEETMEALEILQRRYRSLTGRDYVKQFYLTDYCNRATLQPNHKPREK